MYKGLSRAQLSFDYLHTNSTTHEFLFGALAELLDNARDAFATKINIYSVSESNVRGGYLMCFLDDGQGMSPEECSDIITFGKSTKKCLDSQMIGMYGNGLKSGSMRIGNDFILFTKKAATETCVMLSRTFHESEHLEEIIVPMPSFDSQTKRPLIKTPKEKEKHMTEMELVLKYSPFKTEAQFLKEFDKIEGTSGTLVIIYNLKLLDTGQTELDVQTDPYDIILSQPNSDEGERDDGSLMPERKSFRSYASILYVEPRMRVYIQGKKVRTKRLISTLYKPRLYKYSSARFKTRAENEAKKAEDDARLAEHKAHEYESKAKDLELKFGDAINKDQRLELRKAQSTALELRKEAQMKKVMAERKTKSLKDPKTLVFVFGMNIENRSRDGIFVYNCSRLIKMYQKVGPQADGGVFCSGVVGVVDVPYLVLEPTHNKQDFADAKEYRHLQHAMAEHMAQYWRDLEIAQQGVSKFWETFGYISPNWRDLPSEDPKFVRKRTSQVQITLQCDLCLRWRIIPFSANNVGKVFPDDWVCSMNPDPSHNRCSSGEEKMNIIEGTLQKVTKTKEQKERELAEEIKKKQVQLEKIQKNSKAKAKESSSSSEDNIEDLLPNKNSTVRSAKNSLPSPIKRNFSNVSKKAHLSSESDDGERTQSPPNKKFSQKPKASTKSTADYAAKNMGINNEKIRKSNAIKSSSSTKKSIVMPSPSREGLRDVRLFEDEDGPLPPPSIAHTTYEKSQNGILMGTKVQVMLAGGNWTEGEIVEENRQKDKWKIKFKKPVNGLSEKWFMKDSCELKFSQEAINHEVEICLPQQGIHVPPDSRSQDVPTPSSTTAAAPSFNNVGLLKVYEDISNNYKTCLRYFLPPHWCMDKETVTNLNVDELSNFPLDDFFNQYEKGLRKLVSNFQQEAQMRQQDSETANRKLSSVRKMIAKLLKTINEEFEIEPECDTDEVDDLLQLCLRQALVHSNKTTNS